jgi:NADH:ubiquinone oxidoreductase subunit H
MGILRGAATTISYEATYMFCILLVGIVFSTVRLKRFLYHGNPILLPVFPLILICLLAEIHRTPFDFRERERELVRGYNTEYRGKHFAFLFLGEYSILLFNRILIGLLLFGATSAL